MYKISQSIGLEISKDGMEAYIILLDHHRPDILNEEINNYIDFSEKNIEQIIKEIKDIIKVGLKEDQLRRWLLNTYNDKKICIAEGILPIAGKDGYIKYYFDTEKKLTPKILIDGTVDYRELGIVTNVKKGDLLAEIIPPSKGIDGYKVTGQIIPYKKGKKPRFKYGKNVRLLDDGLSLVANEDGRVELKDDKVIVSKVFEVENVDNNVGNIYFNGTVIVKGNVLNGFQVNAQGDVQVKGVVEGAYIESTGHVIVNKGIQGFNRLTVKNKGNLVTKFIQNSLIYSDGNITAEAIMHSQVNSRGNIVVLGKKGLIVGGICRSGEEISARTIGSTMATSTILEVGVDPYITQRSKEIIDSINNIKENLEKVIKSLNLLDNLRKAKGLDEKKTELYIKLLNTRNNFALELKKLQEESIIINKKLERSSKGRVKVADTIYPGVKITIGNSSYFVRDEMKRCTFYIEEGNVRIGPY